MQDVASGGVRRAGAVDEREGRQRHRLGAGIGDALGDREHVVVVDRDHAGEAQPLAVVPGERDRMAEREGGGRSLPHRVGPRHLDLRVGGDPAFLGVVGAGLARGREQADVVALGIGGDVVVAQHDVVDGGALERDRALEARARHRDAGTRDHRFGVGLGGDRCAGARGRRRRRRVGAGAHGVGAGGRGGVAGSPGCPAGSGLVLLALGLRGLLGRRLGLLHQVLEPDHDQDGRDDGEDQVLLVVHGGSRRQRA